MRPETMRPKNNLHFERFCTHILHTPGIISKQKHSYFCFHSGGNKKGATAFFKRCYSFLRKVLQLFQKGATAFFTGLSLHDKPSKTIKKMKILLLIGTGSFIGGILRYLLSQLIQVKTAGSFPYGTLTVNILGCFLIGLVFALVHKGGVSDEWKLFLTTGLLGGFTTFSAFSNETVMMLRESQYMPAAGYVSGSVLLGLAATFAGYALIRNI